MSGIFKHSARFLWREGMQAEMRLVFLALVLTTAAIATVGFLTDRIGAALSRQSNELLAADAVVESTRAIPAAWEEEAARRELKTARYQEFRSVLVADEKISLSEVKAVTPGYPLRGRLILSRGGQERMEVRAAPPVGRVWMEKALLRKLGLGVGDMIALGKATFAIDAAIEQEPDRGGSLFSLAPRVMMNLADLQATDLIGEGSRISFHLLLAGADEAVAAFKKWLQPRLGPHYRMQSVRDTRREVRVSLERAERFLGLSLLVTVVLSCLAIWVAMNNWVHKRLIHTAVLRSIGMTRGAIAALYLVQLTMLSVIGCLLALGIAYGMQTLLLHVLQQYMSTALPAAGIAPALWACLLGYLLVLAFSLPAYWRLVSVSPMWVLRTMPDELQPVRWSLLFGLSALAFVLHGITGDLRLMTWTIGGLLGAMLLLLLLAVGMLWLMRRLSHYQPRLLKFAMRALSRHRRETLMAICVFGLSFMFVIILTLIRTDLIDQWRGQLPADTPNMFLINIQPNEVDAVQSWLSDRGLTNIEFWPSVRGRLVKINGQAVTGDDFNSDRAKRTLRREFNLSWADAMPSHNEFDEAQPDAQWWRADTDIPQWSVETGIAEVFDVGPGDTLTYDIAGQEVTGRISSWREVRWDSFKINFFVIGTRGMLEEMPTRYIGSFYLPPESNHLMDKLVLEYPSVTALDVAALMQRVRTIIDRVGHAVEAAFAATLAAAILLVAAMVMSTRRLRQHENALLRAMGASGRLLAVAQNIEFLLIGACAGVLAVILANFAAWQVSKRLLDIGFNFNFPLAAIVVVAGMLLVMLVGWVLLRDQHRQTPMVLLKAG